MTAREVLDGINTRLAAATPGPWTWSPELDTWGDCGPNLETVERGPVYSDGSQGAAVTVIGSWGHDANGISVEQPDAEFIAAAPADVARLTRAVEAVLELHQQVEGYIFGAVPGAPPEYPVCSICFTDDERPEPWPCPTVAAIENALTT